MLWTATQQEQPLQQLNYILRRQGMAHFNRQTLTSELVQHRQEPYTTPFLRSILRKVVGPDMVAMTGLLDHLALWPVSPLLALPLAQL